MSDTKRTRRTDEPPTRDGAQLAGWPVTITAEEAAALQKALKQLQTALDAVVRDRDEARAEVARLREAPTEIAQTRTSAPGGFDWNCTVETIVEDARADLKGPNRETKPLIEEIEDLLAEDERLRKAPRAACGCDDLLRAAFTRLLDRLTRERDEARAEVERLREALVLGSEVLASHQGSPQREWHSAGAWLYPGDSINVVRAPLPEIEVVS